MRRTVIALLTPLFGRAAPWLVPGYAFMLALGALLGALVVVDATARAGYPRRRAIEALFFAYLGGLVGAAMVPLAQATHAWIAIGRFRAPSGLAAYGGLLGGLAACAIALRRQRLAVLPFLDAGAHALGLGYFFARLGCFLAGCDYGRPTGAPFGVRFPQGSYAWIDHVDRGWIAPDARASLPVHPTQLYLAFLGLALFLVIPRLPGALLRRDGARVAAYFALYAVGRIAVESLRGDASRGAIGALSTSQAIAVATLVGLAAVSIARVVRSSARAS
jgi:prolipoprotein diacylglyceryl transferase